jgi:hypothetical protein
MLNYLYFFIVYSLIVDKKGGPNNLLDLGN